MYRGGTFSCVVCVKFTFFLMMMCFLLFQEISVLRYIKQFHMMNPKCVNSNVTMPARVKQLRLLI